MQRLHVHLLSLFFLLFSLSGCNLSDPVPNETPQDASAPQLDVNTGDATACIDCPGGCIVGFPFNYSIPPQGKYPVRLITGDCECSKQSDGSWTWTVTGPSTKYLGHTGGPGSGSANIVGAAQTLWGFQCSGNGGGGGPMQGGWLDWVAEVSHQLQVNPHLPIGTGLWPTEWNVHVHAPVSGGPIRIDVPGNEQASALTTIRVIGNGNHDVIAEFYATGEPSYNLDLSSLPNGFYSIELYFEPGFYLSSGFMKAEPA